MRKRFHLSRRRRVLWTGIVLFCLLFQQLAMAAYVCTLPTASIDIVMTGDCAAMGMSSAMKTPASHHASTDPRCAEHCASNTASAHDARLPTVPPLPLAPASPMLLGTLTQAPDQVALPNTALHRPDPPPTLRFCSLLI
ncbi:hypothetical protein EAH75_03115 [Rhodanobacter glycinis]|uniref:DUF2946 domain-containing protein n=1 Tax=Rhodanobacter glycinis TaxID=582702 RepID=A0A502BZG9_9GAMM|nr:hypothetical protein [Rhodanobacter glycinis]TPG05900.1 hypothetical protein EAH88_14750 [Rhodanobacter glycinis]TPG50461.1 hypothetical protein EAH75_03115 [Rhodanobacter glycinis]